MPMERIGPFEYRRHRPTRPALTPQGDEARPPRVLVVGGGPVGLAVALGLARWGIASAVIEADDSVCEGSRAACISRRSLEILQRLGAVNAFLDKGLAWHRGRSFYGTEEVLVFEMPRGEKDQFPPMINLEQYYIEQFLLDAIERVNAATPGVVDVRWASQVVGFAPDATGVTVDIEAGAGRYRIRADWLVACDGGQSFVRTALGLELKGTGYQGRYAIVDIELASSHPTERRAWFDPPWARGTTILMHRQPDNIWRVDYQLAAGQDAAEVMQPEQMRRFVQTHLDAIGEGHLPWTPVWTSIYRAGAMTLDAYRHGRILFAGNSAHAIPIFGVRGLNSGFDDADNLIWKLAAVVQGKAGESLLDSYSSERVQAFHTNAASAMRSTEFMSPPHRGFELMREACLSLASRHRGIARLINPRQTHAIVYEDSALSSADAEPDASPIALGAPLLDLQIAEGQYLVGVLAPDRFTLLSLGPESMGLTVESISMRPPWAHLPCRAVTLPPSLLHSSDWTSAYGPHPDLCLLVRPDGHVCGKWRCASADTVLRAIQTACSAEEVLP